LDDNGLSVGQIGAVLSVFGFVGVLVGLVVNHLGERAARATVGAACTTWIGLVALLPAASGSTLAIIAFLALSGWASTTVLTITYPLGAEGAVRSGLAPGAIMGGLNTAWALSASVAPLAAGAIVESRGFGAAWLAIAATQIAGSLLVFRVALRRRRPAQLLAR
jgi:predicted MFS family arabinose efflux permease